jgi:hypothetical protein
VTLRGVLIAGDNLPKAGRHTALAASGGIHARADTPHWRFGGTQAKAERKNFEQVGYRLCRHAGVASDNTCNGASGELRNATTPTKAELKLETLGVKSEQGCLRIGAKKQ